jgi:hypothetical protein
VNDHFATFSLPRSPWLDTDDLKCRFLRLSATRHPDAGGSAEAFAALNDAWQTLRDPAACLRHYLELEHPAALATATHTPPELGDLFMDIATARQAAQQFATRLAAASSPLARSLLDPERLSRRNRLDALAAQVAKGMETACATLHSGTRDPDALAAQLATLVFLGKWSAQLRESALALA